MSIDHCGFDIPVSEELLDRPDIVAGFEEVRGEGMAERVASRPGSQAGLDHSVADGSLDERFVNVVAPLLAGLRTSPPMFLGEDPLPAPFTGRPGVLAVQRIGHLDTTQPSARSR